MTSNHEDEGSFSGRKRRADGVKRSEVADRRVCGDYRHPWRVEAVALVEDATTENRYPQRIEVAGAGPEPPEPSQGGLHGASPRSLLMDCLARSRTAR
jgi:hypothetical protein